MESIAVYIMVQGLFIMSDRKPRLLFVGAFPPSGKKIYGGNVTDCNTLLEAGLAKHFDLFLVDSTQRSVPPPPVWWRFLDSLPRGWKFLELVLRHRPDAILIFTSCGLSFLEKSLFALFGRLQGCRILFFPRGGPLMDDCRSNLLYRYFVKNMMRFPHVLLCQGQVWQDFFTKEMNLPSEKCIVLMNWTATSALLQIGANREYKDEPRPLILFIGWVYCTKGIFELLDAITMLHQRFPTLELLIAGEGEDSERARRYVFQKGLSESVKFLGWINGDSKLKTLSKATIFCLPSHVEGLPNAMIEAMAAGLPSVVTPVGAIPNVICDGQNGSIIPIGDSHALANQIERLVRDTELRARLGRAAHETASREFNATQAISRLVELLQ